MSENPDLQNYLRALAEALPQNAGPTVRCELLAHLQRRRVARKRRTYFAVIAASLAIAAGLCLSVWRHPGAGRELSSRRDIRADGFIALPYAQSEVPLEQPIVVRVDIPVSELGSMGIPLAPGAARGRVKADFLVGQDGVARGVRFVEQVY